MIVLAGVAVVYVAEKSKKTTNASRIITVAAVKLGEDQKNFKMNANGSCTLVRPPSKSEPKTKKYVEKKMAPSATMTTVTLKKLTDVTTTTVVEEVTVMPSTRLFALMAHAQAAQVKIKSMVSFGQISANVGFNCNIHFPSSVERALATFGVLNLDLVPSLSLQCRFSSFDYIHKVRFVVCLFFLFFSTKFQPTLFSTVFYFPRWSSSPSSHF
jgi:hypothetical protein